MGVVNQWKCLNQFQPQTLVIATILCYVDAFFDLIFASSPSLLACSSPLSALAAGGSASPTRSGGATRSPSAARCCRS